jgi:hypothetical protein
MSDASETRVRAGPSLRNCLVGLLCCGVSLPLSSLDSGPLALAAAFFLLVGVGFSVAVVWGGIARLMTAGRFAAPLAFGAVAVGTVGLALGGVTVWRAVGAVRDASDRTH